MEFTHIGMTNQVGEAAHIEIRGPQTHMGGWTLAVHEDITGHDPGRTLVFDHAALKALVLELVRAL
jgi:hypothetical protein